VAQSFLCFIALLFFFCFGECCFIAREDAKAQSFFYVLLLCSFFWDALKYIPTEISSLRDFAVGNGFGVLFVVLSCFYCLYL